MLIRKGILILFFRKKEKMSGKEKKNWKILSAVVL